jgi:hypothetical protein
MPNLLSGLVFLALDVLAILLLVATWQRTRIPGFAVVAASVAMGIALRWLAPFLYRSFDLSDPSGQWLAMLVTDGLYTAMTAIAVVGFWNIYRRLAAPPAAPPA